MKNCLIFFSVGLDCQGQHFDYVHPGAHAAGHAGGGSCSGSPQARGMQQMNNITQPSMFASKYMPWCARFPLMKSDRKHMACCRCHASMR